MANETREQIAAVQTWAKQHGRTWKADLRRAWASGNYNGFHDAPLLQQIRNTFGPSWLASCRLPVEVPAHIAGIHEPIEPARLAWMESILSNDEASSDYELKLFFVAHGVPAAMAESYIARRTDYLNTL